MRARTAEEQAIDRQRVLRRTVNRTHKQELVQRQLGVMPVATRNVKFAFDVSRRQQFAGRDALFNIRGILRDRCDNGLPERFSSPRRPILA